MHTQNFQVYGPNPVYTNYPRWGWCVFDLITGSLIAIDTSKTLTTMSFDIGDIKMVDDSLGVLTETDTRSVRFFNTNKFKLSGGIDAATVCTLKDTSFVPCKIAVIDDSICAVADYDKNKLWLIPAYNPDSQSL